MNSTLSEQVLAQQRAVLVHMQEAISSLGYETRLFDAEKAGGILPGPMLVAGVERDSRGRDRTINFSFLPLPFDNDFDYLSLIQCYAPLPFAVPDGRRTAVEKTLAELNCQTALGYFGVTAEGNLFYRYVIATAKWAQVEVETIQQLLFAIVHMLHVFSLSIEATALGAITE